MRRNLIKYQILKIRSRTDRYYIYVQWQFQAGATGALAPGLRGIYIIWRSHEFYYKIRNKTLYPMIMVNNSPTAWRKLDRK